VVDDDPLVRTALERLLRSFGYDASAAEFLGASRQSQFACLILDICMPKMSGVQLYQRLTEDAALLPTIFMSAHDKPVLCGNSLGGLAAIGFSIRHPGRVAGLVLAGSAGLHERNLSNGSRMQPTRAFVRGMAFELIHRTTPDRLLCNSDGDLAMLQYTTIGNPRPSFGLLVHHTDADREYAYDKAPKSSGKLIAALADAPRRGWTVVDMKRDWKRVFAD
jgi:CheY-like chemotaxis protein